ncbi:MAG: tRNA uridine(34) 5-carboxymethylaminomethyl modification radical SAM/GNAT enzyme Elp3 [Candidatus Diapherotrites archaeon]|uniref:Elongator complex protein 3 n=1 Tax=Candidatus Iainarchaeum sp. TaxID=3101447 RepID=A0A8T4L7H9_9ARCH|nr:tRNA uridine(34) 5-carboxymethylaminomethyl modification radical SAM/GNAT enzyme Elp3 [Candidatus Diapherotrites archaeon]
MASLQVYAQKVIAAIDSGEVNSKDELSSLKARLCTELKLESFPTDPDLLAFAKHPSERVRRLLSIKPVRNLSGVAVVAVMSKPAPCPAHCTYCPSGIGVETPKSYTGHEPSTMRAIRLHYNPYAIVENRIHQFEAIGHNADKIELIVQGGTFPSLPWPQQKYSVKRMLDGVCGKTLPSLARAKKACETARHRVVGLTIETRPDWCGSTEINRLLSLGATRVELGVQTLDESIYRKTARGHSVQDVALATQRLRDTCFKMVYHWMPGQPGSTREGDLADFQRLFDDSSFRPDMLKFYPCLVIPGTPLYRQWKQGKFQPLSSEQAAEEIAEMKRFIPKYVRVMRVNRDIPSTLVAGGVSNTNLRQLVEAECRAKGIRCQCIRCREAGLFAHKKGVRLNPAKAVFETHAYEASGGREHFISLIDPATDALYGFVRLRIPFRPFRKEVSKSTGLVRELHVYSHVVPLEDQPADFEFQHRGFGRTLMEKAADLAREQGMEKLGVLAGLGVRAYYRKQLGYHNEGPYVSRAL